ncbi:hypothetical protein FBU59_004170 [Linderina macrospora]|uniref:Uncharacterized protein n=1 Tax=Linderina macrospora TaxID=4868 RepID=A0ACC1J672_9FUNG|nr:hypothetical protein FBU59_004170 [Linderina macrospora]
MQHQAMLNMPINHQPHMAAQMNMYQAQQAAMSGVGLFPVHQQIPAPSPRMQQILKTSPVSQKSHRQPGAEQLPRSDSRQQQQVVGSGLEQQPVSANPGLEQAPEVKPTEESESRSLASVSVQDQQQASLFHLTCLRNSNSR